MQTYRGRITLADGDEVDVDLEMTDESIRLATDAAEIGTWARAEFHIVRVGDGVFEIVIDGDRVSFEPFEVEPFEESMGSTDGVSPHVDAAWDSEVDETADDDFQLEDASGEADQAAEGIELEEVGLTFEAPLDGEEVSAWALVTPQGPVDNGWNPSSAVEEAVTGLRDEPSEGHVGWPSDDVGHSADLSDDATEDAWSLDEDSAAMWSITGPRWSVVASDDDEAEGSDVVSAGEPDRADQDGLKSQEEAVAESDGRRAGAGAGGGGPLEADGGTGWNYELLAEALAELETEADEEISEAPVGGDATADAKEGSTPGGGRFGGSSVERLAAAVDSLKRREVMTPADEAVAAAREEDEDDATVADGVLASQRSLRETKIVKRITWDLIRKVGAGVLLGIGIAVLVVLFPSAWEVLTRDRATETTVESATTIPTTTTVTADGPTTATSDSPVGETTTTTVTTTTTTTVPPGPTVFEIPASEFVQAWNDVAGPIDPVLTFAALPPIGEFENEFFEQLSMLGAVSEDGTVERFSVVIDPTGPAESDRLGMQALGIALKVLDPNSTGSSRAALLRSLGLDVAEPNLAGIDSSIDIGGIEYALRYDSETVTLTLSISPEGAEEASPTVTG
jgi:hypothetical protein